jgi:acetyl esterase/lipase
MARTALLLTLLVPFPALADDQPEVVNVWPATPPDEPGTIGKEYTRPSPKLDKKKVEVTESTLLVTNVTKPTLTIYRPAKDKDTGTAVIICPGGGYWNLYWQLEGEEVAAWLNSIGVTGIILKYRVPRRPDEPEKDPARRPLQDAQRAVSLVRSKAKEWGSTRTVSASWASPPAATSPSPPPPASKNAPTTRSTTWTKSVAAPTSPSPSIPAT